MNFGKTLDSINPFKEMKYLEKLVSDVQLLADFAEDRKRNFNEVQAVRKLIYSYCENKQKLTDDEINELLALEAKLLPSPDIEEERDVTTDTLRATGGDCGNTHVWSVAGLYMMILWVILFGMVGLAVWFDFVLLCNAEANWCNGTSECAHSPITIHVVEYFNPFVFGAIGACTYLLRISGQRLHNRSFNPARFPEHINRLVLGALSGGIIIILLKESVVDAAAIQGVTHVPLGVAALGFVAGYSVELLYQVLDRIISSIVPAGPGKQSKNNLAAKKISSLLERNTLLLDELKNSDNPDKTQIASIEALIRHLKS